MHTIYYPDCYSDNPLRQSSDIQSVLQRAAGPLLKEQLESGILSGSKIHFEVNLRNALASALPTIIEAACNALKKAADQEVTTITREVVLELAENRDLFLERVRLGAAYLKGVLRTLPEKFELSSDQEIADACTILRSVPCQLTTRLLIKSCFEFDRSPHFQATLLKQLEAYLAVLKAPERKIFLDLLCDEVRSTSGRSPFCLPKRASDRFYNRRITLIQAGQLIQGTSKGEIFTRTLMYDADIDVALHAAALYKETVREGDTVANTFIAKRLSEIDLQCRKGFAKVALSLDRLMRQVRRA